MKTIKAVWFVRAAFLGIVLIAGCTETYVDTASVSAPIGAIKPDKAIEIAVRHAGFESVKDVNLRKCEVDGGILKPVYEIEFTKLFREYEYDIDARSGSVVKAKKEFGW